LKYQNQSENKQLSQKGVFQIRLHHHSAISLIGSGMIYLVFHSLSAAVAFFFSGILIDLDHFFEYWHKFGLRDFSLRKFFRAAHNHEYSSYFVLLHSYELAAILLLVGFIFIRKPWFWGFVLGFTVHIISDQIYNPCHPLTYSLLFRIKHKFNGERLFPLEKREKYARRREKKVKPGARKGKISPPQNKL